MEKTKKLLTSLAATAFFLAIANAGAVAQAQALPTPIQAPTSMPGLAGMPPMPNNMPITLPNNIGNQNSFPKQSPAKAKGPKFINVANPNLKFDISRVLPQMVGIAQDMQQNKAGFENFNEDGLMYQIKKVDKAFWDKYKSMDFVAYTQSEEVAVVGMKTPNCKAEQAKVQGALNKSKIRYEGVTCAGSYVRVLFKNK